MSATIFFISIAVLQDLLHSGFNHYSFYFSESVLFNSGWLLFLPAGLLLIEWFKKVEVANSRISSWLQVFSYIVLSSFVHVLLFSVLLYSLSALFLDHVYGFRKNISYTVSEDLYKYILIYGAIAVFYFRKHLFQPKPVQDFNTGPGGNFIDKIVTGTGRNKIIILPEEIIYINSASPYISIHTASKKYLHAETLKAISQKLKKDQFARVHKSAIVNLSKVVSFKSRLNGDYDLLLSNGELIRLSRNYAAAFKQLFKNSSS
ncbi:MAG: LytTR family transcriptional regulator [Chitinophagaceae bacterium]|nr:LytTR family transcriptional regulator [Chitinophagaceae bacterium]